MKNNFGLINLALDEIRKSAYRINLCRTELFHLETIQKTADSWAITESLQCECDKHLERCLDKMKEALSEMLNFEDEQGFLKGTDAKLLELPYKVLYEEE